MASSDNYIKWLSISQVVTCDTGEGDGTGIKEPAKKKQQCPSDRV